MEKSKFNKDWPNIKKSWEIFMRLVRGEISDLEKEQNIVEIEIKKAEHLLKLIESSLNDINALLNHEKMFVNAYPQSAQNIEILRKFKEKNNLDNDIAVRIYNQLINSTKKDDLEKRYDELLEKSNELQDRIAKLTELKNGEEYSIELITELIEKYNLSNASHLLIYPIARTLRKEPLKKEKIDSHKVQINDQENEVTIPEIKSVEVPEITTTILEDAIEKIDDMYSQVEIKSYKDAYEILKQQYDEFSKSNNLIFSKYYNALNEMKPVEKQYYKLYCSYTEDELKEMNIFDKEYDFAISIMLAMKLFDMKEEIDKIINELSGCNYSNKEYIEYLEECLVEANNICNKLIIVDKKICSIEKEMMISQNEESKVFFATDRQGNTFIPEEFKSGISQKRLIKIMENAQEGMIQKKKVGKIKPFVPDKKFNEETGKTVFSVRNTKIIVSYIKLNELDNQVNDGGIMIITAVPIHKGIEGIEQETHNIVKDNRDNIINQIDLIEKKDPIQIGIQSAIRKEIETLDEFGLEEGEENGKKVR